MRIADYADFDSTVAEFGATLLRADAAEQTRLMDELVVRLQAAPFNETVADEAVTFSLPPLSANRRALLGRFPWGDSPYDGGTHLIEQGSYVLTPDALIDYPNSVFSELDLLAEGRSFATVSLRTTVRLLSTNLPPELLFGVVGRQNSDAQGRQATGVLGAVRWAGRLTLGVFNAETDQDQTWHGAYGPVSTLLVDNEVNLQLDIFAGSAALTAWNVGDPRPVRPQIFVRDRPSYVPTACGVGLWTGQNRSISMRPVAFRYFEAAQPLVTHPPNRKPCRATL